METSHELCNASGTVLNAQEERIGITQKTKMFLGWLINTIYLVLSIPVLITFWAVVFITIIAGGSIADFQEGIAQFATIADHTDYYYLLLFISVLFSIMMFVVVLARIFKSTFFNNVLDKCGSRIDAAAKKLGTAIDSSVKKVFKKHTKTFYWILSLSAIALFCYGIYLIPGQAKKSAPISIQTMMQKERPVINSAAIVINNEVINGKADIELMEDGRYIVSFITKDPKTTAINNDPIENDAVAPKDQAQGTVLSEEMALEAETPREEDSPEDDGKASADSKDQSSGVEEDEKQYAPAIAS